MARLSTNWRALRIAGVLTLLGTMAAPALRAQQSGTISGRVTREALGSPLAGVSVSVQGTGISTVTAASGHYILERVPAGLQSILFRRLGQRPAQRAVTVAAGDEITLDVSLAEQPVALGEIVVSGASRLPERVVEAPAAVSVVDPLVARDVAVTGQPARTIQNLPGIDAIQSGMNDFNVNARGFNTTLNRRVLVLQDGRDLAVAFLGSQEWSAFALPTDDFQRIEVVRGPGSALYGANAFSGVLNMSTPPARDVQGTKLTLAGGQLSTFRGDLRHAGVFGQGRFGYRVNVGYQRSGTWTKARTRFDGTDIVTEYEDATNTAVDPLDAEERPLAGQSTDPVTLSAVGDPDPLENLFGSARIDYYMDDGSVLTADGGIAQSKNGVAVTGLGRVQIRESLRPWARVAWAADKFNLMAYYSGRTTPDTQVTLSSKTAGFLEFSALWHVEGQYNTGLLGANGRLVIGGSLRNTQMDTRGTLMPLSVDNRSDNTYSAFSQIEYRFGKLRAVAALRWDESDLYEAQLSPKVALVYSLNDDHSIRLTFNHAFQTPNYSEFFLLAPAAAPSGTPFAVENGLETLFQTVNGLGLAAGLNLPNTLPWDFDSLTNVLALGNDVLEVETVNAWEVGYKGSLSPKVFLTVDLYFAEIKNFVTDLLACVNPQYPCYSLEQSGTIDIPRNLSELRDRIDQLEAGAILTPAEAAAFRASIDLLTLGYTGVSGLLGPVLATLPSGSRAGVVSYGNAGRVLEGGAEVGLGVALTDEVSVNASYGYFNFKVREAPGELDDLVPNSPTHRGAFTLSYRGRRGLDASATLRFASGYSWLAGVFGGWVPARQTLDASVGYAVNNNLRVFAVATNLRNQQRFQMYGGSVIGRRILGGLTTTF